MGYVKMCKRHRRMIANRTTGGLIVGSREDIESFVRCQYACAPIYGVGPHGSSAILTPAGIRAGDES